MNKIEEKAKEYADFHYGDMEDPENLRFVDDHEETMKDFKAGFEAGQQEERNAIIEKLREIVDASESNNCSWALMKYIDNLETLSK